MKKLIISVIGKDKPGIVAAFTNVLYSNSCNVEDTSMTLLEDHFTMLFIVSVPLELTVKRLEECLSEVLQDFHLELAIHIIDTEDENPPPSGRPWMISVSGRDQTGIIFHVAHYMASRQINVRHLSSKRLTQQDGSVFLMAIEADIPPDVRDEELHRELNEVAERENLEIHAEPLEVYTL